jgi:basic amino acid/polyamine antiporter, APA family
MQAAETTAQEAKLVRAIGVPGLAANIVNSTVGAGIFVLPALVAAGLGAASPLAYLACAVAMCLFVTSFAMAGSRVSLTGGLYAYVEVAFGRYVGFLAGILYALTALVAVSGVVNIFATSVGALAPVLAAQIGRFIVILSIYGCLAGLNIRGVRIGARAVEAVTLIKLVPLIIFIAVGIFFIQPKAITLPSWPGSKALGDSVLLLIFAFVGVEVALVPSGEIRHPARTVPRAIYVGLVVTTLLYVIIQLVAQGVLGPELGKYPDAPLAEAAARFIGPIGKTLLLAGATISAFGFVTSDILSSPRIIFAFGRDGFLPSWFAHIHPRFRTPDAAIITYTVIAFALSFSSTFQQLAILSNVAVLLLYLLCCLAALELRRRDIRGDRQPFNFPGATLVPVLAIVFIVWILAHATLKEFGINALCLAVASIFFLLRDPQNTNLAYSAAGAIMGGFIAFLLRPVLIGHQVGFQDIITRGANLKGVDELAIPLAQTSFNFLVAGAILGGLIGLSVAYIKKRVRITAN